jgi:hypothetical protein
MGERSPIRTPDPNPFVNFDRPILSFPGRVLVPSPADPFLQGATFIGAGAAITDPDSEFPGSWRYDVFLERPADSEPHPNRYVQLGGMQGNGLFAKQLDTLDTKGDCYSFADTDHSLLVRCVQATGDEFSDGEQFFGLRIHEDPAIVAHAAGSPSIGPHWSVVWYDPYVDITYSILAGASPADSSYPAADLGPGNMQYAKALVSSAAQMMTVPREALRR